MKKQQKSKYRFNIIDVLLILVLIAVIGVIYYFVAGRDDKASQGEKIINYTIELKTVDKDYLDSIQIGDKVIETVRNRTIGKVVDVEYGPSWAVTTNTETGEMIKSYYPAINLPLQEEPGDEEQGEQGALLEEEEISEIEPVYDYYNVLVTVESDADYTGSSYSIGGFEVVVGEMIYFRLPHFANSGYCISLEEIE